MKIKTILVCHLLFPLHAFAADSLFCPQHYGTIRIGMTQQQVISACGQPLSKQPSDKPITRKVPLTELYFNNEGTPVASVIPGSSNGTYSGLWGNPVNVGGGTLQLNVIDNKIYSIELNGSQENAVSICGGGGLKIGDPVAKAYNTCGTPLLVNHTYINQIINTEEKPEVWIYQPGQYQPTASLTFVAGKLQSIN
jgi:hypothetical protein